MSIPSFLSFILCLGAPTGELIQLDFMLFHIYIGR